LILTYPGAENCPTNLTNLSKLRLCSNDCPEFFYQLSQICHNIQILRIEFRRVISNGLAYLISVQRNLKCLDLSCHEYNCGFTDFIPSLMKISNSLIKFSFY